MKWRKPLTEIAWAGGLFEGEGCIAPQGQNRSVVLKLASTDADIIQRFHRVVGLGTMYGPIQPKTQPKKNGELRKPVWYWQTARIENVIAILADLWPYLGERRQAKALEQIERYSQGGK